MSTTYSQMSKDLINVFVKDLGTPQIIEGAEGAFSSSTRVSFSPVN